MENDKKLDSALYKYSLISPLLHIDDAENRRNIVTKLTEKTLNIPYSCKKRITKKTLDNYLKKYQEGKLEGLIRKSRSDKNKLKRISDSVLTKIIELKKEDPRRSTRQIIRMIKSIEGFEECNLKERTVCRIIKNNCLRKKDLMPQKIYTSFEKEHINELWQADIMDGIYINQTKKMTYLFAFIDDFSRIIPHAQFYYDEKLPRLEDCLKKAILKRGIPKKIYVDNGKIFVSKHLQRICAELGISLVHHQPYSPQSKGKIERFFLRLQKEFLTEAMYADIKSIEELNSFLVSWIEVEYHRVEHMSIGTTPMERYISDLKNIKLKKIESLEEITEIFLWREKRHVNKNTGIIKFNQNSYCVNDYSLLGTDVEIRFDPYDISRIFVYFEDRFIQMASPVKFKNSIYKNIPQENNKELPAIRKSSMEYLARIKQKELEFNKIQNNSIDFTKINLGGKRI